VGLFVITCVSLEELVEGSDVTVKYKVVLVSNFLVIGSSYVFSFFIFGGANMSCFGFSW
jgi:hypothetical protein